MSVRFALLHLLNGGPANGHHLRSQFEEALGQWWPLNVGQVYTTLGRLERDGFVEITPGGDGRVREYELTDAGRDELETWLRSARVADRTDRDDLAVKVALLASHQITTIDVLHILSEQRRATTESLQAWTIEKRQLDPVTDLGRLIMIDGVLAHLEAELRWCDQCYDRLKKAGT